MKKKIALIYIILIIAAFFRFNNLNWDENFHLHPDERFLTMVGQAIKFPETINEYFDQRISYLSPYNVGYNFFVYGNFPLILTKFLAIKFNKDNYNDFTILGRQLSAFFDLMIVVLVYKTTKLLLEILKQGQNTKKNNNKIFNYLPIFSAFFYAISVYPIQSSHFFTVDTFLNFFMFASFYFALKSYLFRNYVLRFTFYVLLSSVFFGLALSSKISALYILPLNLGVIILSILRKKETFLKKIKWALLFTIYHLLFIYLTVRLANPYYFQNPSFFDISLNKDFINSINSLRELSRKDIWYPPAIQWINKPWWGLLSTTFFAGIGPINFLVIGVGLIWILKNLKLKVKSLKSQLKIKNEKIILYLILFWTVGYFVYQSFQFVKSIRYTIYLYPFFAIFGGIGIAVVSSQLNRLESVKSIKIRKIFLHILNSTFYVLLFIWTLSFFTIYLHKNTRVQASEWIYKNLPNNAVILGEYWDDPLPLPIENNYEKNFQVELLPVFDLDTSKKWEKMRYLLSKADYYVLSSNRGWGSIPTVPKRYPLMSKYYQGLLNNDCKIQKEISGVCYQKIKEFLPYYYKFIRYPDSWIEETFTVYDHQTVFVYEKVKNRN